MIVISNKKLNKIKSLYFGEESFAKFLDPTHPQYEDYKDRVEERMLDTGYNNAIEDVLRILLGRISE